ncbi:MAG: hypothetical protein IH921_09150 [Gemmatimonadetes bacterium]|nr:hypothetical protein [Gemmatimonadota bacterium]
MKLVLFDDYKPGVLKEDRVVDVSSAVADLNISSYKRLMREIHRRSLWRHWSCCSGF